MNLKKLSDSEKKVLTFWAILGVVIISGLLIFKLVAPDSFDRLFKLGEYDKKYKLVQDRTRYYTVSNSLIKYYEYQAFSNCSPVFARRFRLRADRGNRAGIRSGGLLCQRDDFRSGRRIPGDGRPERQLRLDRQLLRELDPGRPSDRNPGDDVPYARRRGKHGRRDPSFRTGHPERTERCFGDPDGQPGRTGRTGSSGDRTLYGRRREDLPRDGEGFHRV